MRPVRFRVRTLLIMVVVVAVPAALMGRRARFGERAKGHESERRSVLPGDLEVYLVMQAIQGELHPDPKTPFRRAARPIQRFVTYHLEMESKYEQAARAPWWPVEADPPAPEKPSRAQVERFWALLDRL